MFVEEVETDSMEEGSIFYQSYREGTLIARGANLTIKIAVEPVEEIIPPVIDTPSTENTPSEGEIVE